MNGYEKIINTMRKEATKGAKPFPIKLGTMTSSATCALGQLELDSDDFYVADHLELEEDDLVIVAQVSDEKFVIMEKVVEL